MQTLFILAWVLLSVSTAGAATDVRMAYVKAQLVASGVPAQEVTTLLSDYRLKRYPPKVVKYKNPDWGEVEQRLTGEAMLQKGRDYIAAHQAAFDGAERDYGVPKEVIAGVIAIETDFGRLTGKYSVFNALYTRMETWPEATWKGQAVQLVALGRFCLTGKLDCFAIKGSYAGAFGIGQFMPDSALAYGVDGNEDGSIDLFDPVDAVPSTANFLKRHGWDQSQLGALTRYYGKPVGYPTIVLKYASLIQ